MTYLMIELYPFNYYTPVIYDRTSFIYDGQYYGIALSVCLSVRP